MTRVRTYRTKQTVSTNFLSREMLKIVRHRMMVLWFKMTRQYCTQKKVIMVVTSEMTTDDFRFETVIDHVVDGTDETDYVEEDLAFLVMHE